MGAVWDRGTFKSAFAAGTEPSPAPVLLPARAGVRRGGCSRVGRGGAAPSPPRSARRTSRRPRWSRYRSGGPGPACPALPAPRACPRCRPPPSRLRPRWMPPGSGRSAPPGRGAAAAAGAHVHASALSAHQHALLPDGDHGWDRDAGLLFRVHGHLCGQRARLLLLRGRVPKALPGPGGPQRRAPGAALLADRRRARAGGKQAGSARAPTLATCWGGPRRGRVALGWARRAGTLRAPGAASRPRGSRWAAQSGPTPAPAAARPAPLKFIFSTDLCNCQCLYRQPRSTPFGKNNLIFFETFVVCG